MQVTFKLDDIKQIARQIIDSNLRKIVLVNGEMGAGKTTLIKAICAELGVVDATSSPTFSIVNEYKMANGFVYHFDFYRLKNEAEAIDMGIMDYFYSGNCCFIEWSEKILNLIPEQYSVINISVLDDEKRLVEIVK